MYYYLAPHAERHKVAKALVRVIRNTREMQYCILMTIRAMATTHPDIFQPYLTDFFVEVSEPNFTRKLKIEIMTLLANESNIDRILREFTYYTTREDKDFVAEVIQAIGKCAVRIPEVTDRCMVQLMQLLASKSQAVVAEAVVIIKQLLQMPQNVEGSQSDDVIKQLTRLFNKVKNPKARASIIWVVGEYVDKVGTYAPDILRQLAKEFVESDDTVKNQILNLGAKLMIKNPEQTALIVQYILNLAKYDVNYDIRDKARMMRYILLNPGEKLPVLSSLSRNLYITTKPCPNIPIPTNARFTVGSLAQVINQTTPGYNGLPDWADTIQNADLRFVEVQFVEPTSPTQSKAPNKGNFNGTDLDRFLEGDGEWGNGFDEEGEWEGDYEEGEWDGYDEDYVEGEYEEEYAEEETYEGEKYGEQEYEEVGEEGEEDGEAYEEEVYGDEDFDFSQN